MGFPGERSLPYGPRPMPGAKRRRKKTKKTAPKAKAPVKVEVPKPLTTDTILLTRDEVASFNAKAKREAEEKVELEEIPEEERSHVPQDRFKMVCGVKRIGLEKALIVLENPTCPDCDKVLKKREKDAEIMRGILGTNTSGVEW